MTGNYIFESHGLFVSGSPTFINSDLIIMLTTLEITIRLLTRDYHILFSIER